MHTPWSVWGQHRLLSATCSISSPPSSCSTPGEKILMCSMEKYYWGKSVGMWWAYLPSGLPASLRTKTCCAQPDSPLALTSTRSTPEQLLCEDLVLEITGKSNFIKVFTGQPFYLMTDHGHGLTLSNYRTLRASHSHCIRAGCKYLVNTKGSLH